MVSACYRVWQVPSMVSAFVTLQHTTAQMGAVVVAPGTHDCDVSHTPTLALPVEAPLIQPYLQRFDQHVEAGLSQLRWNTPHADVGAFIEECFETVNIVDEITETMKINLTNVNNIMEKWSSKPLMERKPRPVDREETDRNHKTVKAARYATRGK